MLHLEKKWAKNTVEINIVLFALNKTSQLLKQLVL